MRPLLDDPAVGAPVDPLVEETEEPVDDPPPLDALAEADPPLLDAAPELELAIEAPTAAPPPEPLELALLEEAEE